MQKLTKHKWIIFGIIALLIVLFDALVINVSLNDRAIVVGMGVDMEGEEVVVSCQILLQQNGGVSTGGGKYVIESGKGKTVKGAYDKISDNLGMSLSVAHTGVILFSRNVFEGGKIDLIKDFLTDDEVSDITSLALVEGNTKNILDANVAFGETASLQILRMLKSTKMQLGVIDINLKDFEVSYFSPNAGCFLPIVHKVKGEPNSQQAQEQQTEVDKLVISRTAVISKEGKIYELEGDANEGFTMLRRSIQSGVIDIDGDEGKKVGIQLISVKASPSYDIDEMKVTYTIKVKCVRTTGRQDDKGNISYLMSDKEQQAFKAAINSKVGASWLRAKEIGVDYLQIYKGFYQKYGARWVERAGGNYLSAIAVATEIKVIMR